MARAMVTVGGVARTVNFDDPPRPGNLYQALVIAQLLDEITEIPLVVPVQVTTDLVGARPKHADDGIAGIAGVPTRLFPALDIQAYAFSVRFEAAGYSPVIATVSLGPEAPFPSTFTMADLGQLPARRLAAVLEGTTVTLNAFNQPVPVAGAQVDITGLWRTAAALSGLAVPSSIVSLRPGAYAERPSGAAVKIVTLTPVLGPPRRVVADAAAGQDRVGVSNTAGLAAGTVLGVDRGDPDREEHVEIAQVIAPSDPSSPGTVRLRHPLLRRHRRDSLAEVVTVGALGPPEATLTDATQPGDPTAFVSATAPFDPPQTVRVAGGLSAPEYLTCGRYRTSSDLDGSYRLPPLSRVAAVEVEADQLAFHVGPTPFTPNYSVVQNRLDLTLT